jgi:transcriptional regulator with XRE-family HTH domain
MSTTAIIKDNIYRLLKERDWKVIQLDKKLGSTKSVVNILRGTSKNPTIEVLKNIAAAFDVEVQEIIAEHRENEEINIVLYRDVSNFVLQNLNDNNKIKYNKLNYIIKEVYDYSKKIGITSVDPNFALWFLRKEIS